MSAAPDLCELPYVQFAGCLMCGQVGAELFDTLVAEFDKIGRHDTFLGISIAVAQMRADLLIAELEGKHLRLKLEQQVSP